MDEFKTESILYVKPSNLTFKKNPDNPPQEIHSGESVPSRRVNNLGNIFDQIFPMAGHVIALCKSCTSNWPVSGF